MSDDMVVWEDMEGLISGAMEVGFDDPEQIQMDMVRAILAAEDEESIMAPVGTIPSKDVLGTVLELRDWKPMKSSAEGSKGNYLLLNMADPVNGQQMIVSCGSKVVMAKAIAMKMHGHLPARVVLRRKEHATANGFYPLDLLLAESAA